MEIVQKTTPRQQNSYVEQQRRFPLPKKGEKYVSLLVEANF